MLSGKLPALTSRFLDRIEMEKYERSYRYGSIFFYFYKNWDAKINKKESEDVSKKICWSLLNSVKGKKHEIKRADASPQKLAFEVLVDDVLLVSKEFPLQESKPILDPNLLQVSTSTLNPIHLEGHDKEKYERGYQHKSSINSSDVINFYFLKDWQKKMSGLGDDLVSQEIFKKLMSEEICLRLISVGGAGKKYTIHSSGKTHVDIQIDNEYFPRLYSFTGFKAGQTKPKSASALPESKSKPTDSVLPKTHSTQFSQSSEKGPLQLFLRPLQEAKEDLEKILLKDPVTPDPTWKIPDLLGEIDKLIKKEKFQFSEYRELSRISQLITYALFRTTHVRLGEALKNIADNLGKITLDIYQGLKIQRGKTVTEDKFKEFIINTASTAFAMPTSAAPGGPR